MAFTKLASIRTTSLASALAALAFGTAAMAEERTVSRAGEEYTPPRFESAAAFFAETFSRTSNGVRSPLAVAPTSRAGIEYTPPVFGGVAEWLQVSTAPLGAVASEVRFEPPYANRAGVAKWTPRFGSLAEFRARLANPVN
jgi:hypothetical protein